MPTLGIENLKDFMKNLFVIGATVDNALADDGKISGVQEIFALSLKAVNLFKAVKIADDAYREYLDLDEDEKTEIC